MKRLIATISAAVLMTAGISAVQAAALPTMSPETQSIVTVTSKDGIFSSYVTNSSLTKEAAPLKSVIYAADSLNISGASGSQTINVTSESGKGLASDVFLRLSTETTSKDALYDATKLLKTYDIVIKDEDGNKVYSSSESASEVAKDGASEYVLDMYLGRFNVEEDKESRTYTIDIKLPKNMTASEIKNMKKVSWQIVSDPVEAGATEAPIAEVKITAAPAAAATTTAVSAATSDPAAANVPTPTPKAITPAPTASAEPSATPTTSIDAQSTKKVGTGEGQIKPGTYTITAKDKEAVVKVYGSDGKLKTELAITEAKPSQVVTLVAGDTIENQGRVSLTEYRTATAAPTAKAAAAAAATTRPTTRPTATTAPSSKTNPKTGDTAPISGASALGIFALGMIAYPGLEKRRENNK